MSRWMNEGSTEGQIDHLAISKFLLTLILQRKFPRLSELLFELLHFVESKTSDSYFLWNRRVLVVYGFHGPTIVLDRTSKFYLFFHMMP